MSDGMRGHVASYKEFMIDMKAAAGELRRQGGRLPMHLHANCFATRIAIPFTVSHSEGRVSSAA